jgi:isoleucyl-tRNA synthetase
LPVVGKRYGKLIPALREYLSTADGVLIAAAAARGETQRFLVAGQQIELGPDALLIETESAQGFACAEEGGYLVGLDTRLDDSLRREGLAREVIRAVQDARKQAGLEVADRIALHVEGDAGVTAAVEEHRSYIMAETLASEWKPLSSDGVFVTELDEPEFRCTIRLAKRPPAAIHTSQDRDPA